MSQNKFVEKIKEGISVHEIEGAARKHTTELFSALALIIAGISSTYDYFTGPGLTLFFLTIGALAAMIVPKQIEKGLKQFYTYTMKQEKTIEIIFGAVKIVAAIFVPFIYFGFIGMLAGTSYVYFIRHAHSTSEHRPTPTHHPEAGEEHD